MSQQFFNQGTTTTASTGIYFTNATTAITNNTLTVPVYVNTVSAGTVYLAQQSSPQLYYGQDYQLPDGAMLKIDASGNYKIDDSKAKVIYLSNRVREFNRYINASDLLEKFIETAGEYGVDQSQILDLPVGAFINWLVIEAARKDGDSLEGLPTVAAAIPPRLSAPTKRLLPRCGTCGRFIKHAWAEAKISFCSPAHMQLRLAQL